MKHTFIHILTILSVFCIGTACKKQSADPTPINEEYQTSVYIKFSPATLSEVRSTNGLTINSTNSARAVKISDAIVFLYNGNDIYKVGYFGRAPKGGGDPECWFRHIRIWI